METDTPMPKIKVVIVEDHTIVRDGISYILNSQPDIEVIGTAANGQDALNLMARLHKTVDVVLMDLQMPKLDGVATIRRLRETDKALKIIILTTFDTDEYIFEGIKSGANGYLLKDVPKEELCQAIRSVNRGESSVQPAITSRLFGLLSSQNEPKNNMQADTYLTEREMDVLKLLAKGDRNKEIALKLNITESTVKGYVTIIFQKFNVTDRTEAAMYAVQKGLIKLGE